MERPPQIATSSGSVSIPASPQLNQQDENAPSLSELLNRLSLTFIANYPHSRLASGRSLEERIFEQDFSRSSDETFFGTRYISSRENEKSEEFEYPLEKHVDEIFEWVSHLSSDTEKKLLSSASNLVLQRGIGPQWSKDYPILEEAIKDVDRLLFAMIALANAPSRFTEIHRNFSGNVDKLLEKLILFFVKQEVAAKATSDVLQFKIFLRNCVEIWFSSRLAHLYRDKPDLSLTDAHLNPLISEHSSYILSLEKSLRREFREVIFATLSNLLKDPKPNLPDVDAGTCFRLGIRQAYRKMNL